MLQIPTECLPSTSQLLDALPPTISIALSTSSLCVKGCLHTLAFYYNLSAPITDGAKLDIDAFACHKIVLQ